MGGNERAIHCLVVGSRRECASTIPAALLFAVHMGADIQAAVVSSATPICPEHHVMYVSTASAAEAHYICGVIMSAPARIAIAGYTTTTGKSTHVADVLNIPRFRASDPKHARISDISKRYHERTAHGGNQDLGELDLDLDQAVLSLWNLAETKAKGIRASLVDLLDIRNAGEDT